MPSRDMASRQVYYLLRFRVSPLVQRYSKLKDAQRGKSISSISPCG